MSESENLRYISAGEYLDSEERASTKHEYVRGQVFAMSGASEAHNVICGNLFAKLHELLRGTGCRAFIADMKVRVQAEDSFYYPDIMVSCEPFEAKSVVKHAPRLIVEVTSPSTRQIDRREKLVAYRQLPSLRQYAIVHQNKVFIELYTRISETEWQQLTLTRSDELCLEALPDSALIVPVSSIYEGVNMPSMVEEGEQEYELA